MRKYWVAGTILAVCVWDNFRRLPQPGPALVPTPSAVSVRVAQPAKQGITLDNGDSFLRWEHQGREFVSFQTNTRLSDATVASLRQFLLTVPQFSVGLDDNQSFRTRQHVLKQLKFEPGAAHLHMSELARLAHVKAIPHDFRYLLKLPAVRERALKVAMSQSGKGRQFRVDLDGDPPISVSSAGAYPYMLPWSIEVNGKRSLTVEIAVPLKLASLFGQDTRSTELLDGRKYWPDGFWKDSRAWSDLQDLCNQRVAARLARELRKSKALQRIFQAPSISVSFNADDGWFKAQLVEPSSFTEFNMLLCDEKGDFEASAEHILANYKKAVRYLKCFPWLREWQKSGVYQQASLTCGSSDAYEERRWSLAGLPGKFDLELFLFRNDYRGPACKVQFNMGWDQAVLGPFPTPVSAEKPGWLQRLGEIYNWEGHHFLLVDRSGRYWSDRKIP